MGGSRDQFLRERDVLLAGKTEAVNDLLEFSFRFLDALGDFDFLLARQQGHLAHLLQIHPHGIIENIQAAFVLLLFLLRLGLLDAIHFGLVHDLDLEIAELDVNLVQVVGRNDVVRQRIVDVAVSEVTLLLREAQQFFDLLSQVHTGLSFDGVKRGHWAVLWLRVRQGFLVAIRSGMFAGRVDRWTYSGRLGGTTVFHLGFMGNTRVGLLSGGRCRVFSHLRFYHKYNGIRVYRHSRGTRVATGFA